MGSGLKTGFSTGDGGGSIRKNTGFFWGELGIIISSGQSNWSAFWFGWRVGRGWELKLAGVGKLIR